MTIYFLEAISCKINIFNNSLTILKFNSIAKVKTKAINILWVTIDQQHNRTDHED